MTGTNRLDEQIDEILAHHAARKTATTRTDTGPHACGCAGTDDPIDDRMVKAINQAAAHAEQVHRRAIEHVSIKAFKC